MKLKHAKKNSGFTLVELLVVIAIIAGLAAISSPIIIRQIAKSRATQAISNAKDIYKGMQTFSFKAGRLPMADGTANNSMLPLFITKNIVDEKPFFVKGYTSGGIFTEGDGDVSTGNALIAGENCYSYWTDANTTSPGGWNITTAPASAPILSIPTTAAPTATYAAVTFHQSDFGNQAVILSCDGAATVYPIVEDGTIVADDGIGTTKVPEPFIIGTGTAVTMAVADPAPGT